MQGVVENVVANGLGSSTFAQDLGTFLSQAGVATPDFLNSTFSQDVGTVLSQLVTGNLTSATFAQDVGTFLSQAGVSTPSFFNSTFGQDVGTVLSQVLSGNTTASTFAQDLGTFLSQSGVSTPEFVNSTFGQEVGMVLNQLVSGKLTTSTFAQDVGTFLSQAGVSTPDFVSSAFGTGVGTVLNQLAQANLTGSTFAGGLSTFLTQAGVSIPAFFNSNFGQNLGTFLQRVAPDVISIANSQFGTSLGSFLSQALANRSNGSFFAQNSFKIGGNTFAFSPNKGVYALDSSGNLWYAAAGSSRLATVGRNVASIGVGGQNSAWALIALSAPSSSTAGTACSLTGTLWGANGKNATGYTGTVHFSSSDPKAVLPPDYTYNGIEGNHAFVVTLHTAGTQTVTVTDTATGMTSTIKVTVNPGALAGFQVSGLPSPTTAGVSQSLTIRAMDAYGNTVTGYRGTVSFASSDKKAALPGRYTFTAGDAGTHTFTTTLKTAGTQSITVTDTSKSTVVGSETGIAVKPAAASYFKISSPSKVTHGVAFSITVTAYDPYGNVATGYVGTVHFTSTDSAATLPANSAFTAADAGKHAFEVTLKKTGTDTITAFDALLNSLSGTSLGILVK